MGEKLVFLKREEIRTMAKDLAQLQEQEALKERDRIAGLKTEEKIGPKEKIVETIIPDKDQIPVPLPPDLSSRISKTPVWKKVLVRIVIVLSFFLFLALIGFGYWYLAIRKKENPQPSPSPSASVSLSPTPSPTESISPSPTESINPEIPPIPIIPVKEIKIVDIKDNESFQEQIKTTVQAIVPGNDFDFFEVLAKENNQFLNAKILGEKLELKYPSDFWNFVSGEDAKDFDFVIYSKNNTRQGFAMILKVAPGQEELLGQKLMAWEQTMAPDLNNLFEAMNKQISLSESGFKSANYKNASFRYLSFTEPNLGICWTIHNGYLVITSSGESMVKIINLLDSLK